MNVIVVPEVNDFRFHVSHENVAWINSSLGTPKLKERNVKYLSPYWITDGFRGVTRIYHISNFEVNAEGTSIITLGNSFVLDTAWSQLKQYRRFEYHSLNEFSFVEIKPGLLLKH